MHGDSEFVGSQVRALRRDDLDLDVFQIVRNGRSIVRSLPSERIRAGDVLSVRASQETLEQVLEDEHLVFLPELRAAVAAGDESLPEGFEPEYHAWNKPLAAADSPSAADETEAKREEEDDRDEDADTDVAEASLSEVVLLPGPWSNRRDGVVGFERAFDVTVLAIRRGNEVTRQRLRDVDLQAGDVLPVQTTADVLDRIRNDTNVVVSGDWLWEEFDRRRIPASLGIVAGSAVLPPIAMLATFHLGTAIVTEIVSNNASIVLMLPIAVEVAGQLGVNAFAFALAVTFAASTSLLSPVGYQTNLMVYGSGGYGFTDFARVGAPLQLILTVVTTAGIALLWGL
ncbi:MAG: SLC13 family permease [Halorubrum sp.]